MRIQFCGADRTVTGSSHLVEINRLQIFLDMGIYQGPRDESRRINGYLPADVKSASAIILSHGHLDHCGKLPVAVKAGFKGPIYCTPASAEVARVVLNDSAKIQQEDLIHLNQHGPGPGQAPTPALYGPSDIPAVTRLFHKVPYGQRTDLGNGLSFTFFDAGHILGSAYVILEWMEAGKLRKLLFTGDIGRYDTPILRDPAPLPGPVDYVITESTYGTVSHGPIGDVEPQLLAAVQQCIQLKSRLLIPSFAVGRTQTMQWYIEKFISEGKIPAIPVYIDSPMGVEMSRITTQFPDCYDEQTLAMIGKKDLFGLARVTYASTSDESKRINTQPGPMIIIASSPTCEFGRILHHLEHSADKPNDMVLFVGWTPYDTLGRKLQDGQRHVRIYNRWVDVKFQVKTLHGLSAHADGDELLRFLKPTLSAETSAFVVHGEVPQAEGFAGRLVQAGMSAASVPAMESSTFAFSAEGAGAGGPPPGRADQD